MTRRLNRLQAAFVIGRRDYAATVFSRAFLFFLLGPLFPIVLGLIFGGIGARVADSSEQSRVAVVADAATFARLVEARSELEGLPGTGRLPELVAVAPGQDPRALLLHRKPALIAVLSDPLGTPRLLGSVGRQSAEVGQLRLILARAGNGSAPLPSLEIERVASAAGAVESARSITARAGQALLFFLTLLLSGMLLSQLIEEKSNKVIEVLAAAVPVESIFLGKLFAMLAMTLTGIAVWAAVAVGALAQLAPGALAALPAPAVGWPLFLLLGALYFAMSYLLVGAAFLGIGAQASSVREVQTLSMPVTMSQVGLFALANLAVGGDQHGAAAIFAAAFPLSSPFAMIARAALDPAILPHLAALAWQLLWVGLILRVAAAWFRRSVLSGKAGRKRWWTRERRAAGTA